MDSTRDAADGTPDAADGTQDAVDGIPLWDLRGFRCPLPVLKARVRLKALRPGERAWLRTDDPLATVDVPHFCAEAEQRLVAERAEGDGSHWFLVERGGEP